MFGAFSGKKLFLPRIIETMIRINGHCLKVPLFQLAPISNSDQAKIFRGPQGGTPIACAKILVMFGSQGPEIWDPEGSLIEKSVSIGEQLVSKNLASPKKFFTCYGGPPQALLNI